MHLAVLILSIAVTSPALACGTCVTAVGDYLPPPIQAWAIWAAAWFALNGVLRSRHGAAVPAQPGFGGSLAIVVLALIAGAAALGPLAFLPLVVPPVFAATRSMLRPLAMPSAVRREVRAVALVAIFSATTLGMWSFYKIRQRSEADFIGQWGATAIGRLRFQDLRRSEPRSLDTYRELLLVGDETVVEQAAERIAVIGDPKVDVLLLEAAVKRFRKSGGAGERILKAIEQLRARARSSANAASFYKNDRSETAHSHVGKGKHVFSET